MKIYLKKNVYEAALERINYLFDEFETIIVNVSGGKDSTVVFNLAMQVAKERGRLPLKVLFVDEEAEWPWTVEWLRNVMYRDDVEPYWFQIPIKVENSTSYEDEYLYCWNEDGDWLRDREPISIKENKYGCDRWEGIFKAIFGKEFSGKNTAALSGVRVEESPKRYMWMNVNTIYKAISWGSFDGKDDNGGEHYVFFPIYDWSYKDVWKAINDNGWEYNKVYDYFYNYGISPFKMRVSNLHHESATKILFVLQEVAPDLYEKLAARLQGINMAGKFNKEEYFPKKLPFMFNSWREYRDYLVENVVKSEEDKRAFRNQFEFFDFESQFMKDPDVMVKKEIESVLTTDHMFNRLKSFMLSPGYRSYLWYVRGGELSKIGIKSRTFIKEGTCGKLEEALRDRKSASIKRTMDKNREGRV